MAEFYENKKGFLVLKCTREEFSQIGSPCICDNCGEPIKGDVYYVAALNSGICKKCFDEWYAGAKRYTEDIPIEKNNFNYYAGLL